MSSFMEEMSARLRDWPRGYVAELHPLVHHSLSVMRSMFGASAAVAAWDDGEEPALTVAHYNGTAFSVEESAQEQFLPLVAEELEDLAFYDDGEGVVTTLEGEQRALESVHPDLRTAYDLDRVLTFPIRGETMQGRVFLGRPRDHGTDALRLAQVVGLLFECKLDAVVFCRSAVREAGAAERIRVARDLHDGLLQSFTGIVLQLENVHATIGEDPAAARKIVTELQASMMSDQRELRAYVEQLRPRRRRGELTFDFYSRLEEMRRRFASQWGLRVSIDTEEMDPAVSSALGQETFRIVQEAVNNSAKHGRAAHVNVELFTREGTLHVVVTDDGVGLPIRGRLTLADIRGRGVGPSMLAERVASLNGDITVDSGEGGLKVSIGIPLGWSPA